MHTNDMALLRTAMLIVGLACVAIGCPPQRSAMAQLLDASDFVLGFRALGMPIGREVRADAPSQPDPLSGSMWAATSKVAFWDARLPAPTGQELTTADGGSIELFPSAALAQQRAAYLARASSSGLLLTEEVDYTAGAVVLRLSAALPQDAVDGYVAALGRLTGMPPAPAPSPDVPLPPLLASAWPPATAHG